MGFSHSTGRPANRASVLTAWWAPGTVTSITARAPVRSATAAALEPTSTPSASASARARSAAFGSRSTSPTSRTSGEARRVPSQARPIAPAPTSTTGSGPGPAMVEKGVTGTPGDAETSGSGDPRRPPRPSDPAADPVLPGVVEVEDVLRRADGRG